MKARIKIPKGWRKLSCVTRIKLGDRELWDGSEKEWMLTGGSSIGQKVGAFRSLFIRRNGKAKK